MRGVCRILRCQARLIERPQVRQQPVSSGDRHLFSLANGNFRADGDTVRFAHQENVSSCSLPLSARKVSLEKVRELYAAIFAAIL